MLLLAPSMIAGLHLRLADPDLIKYKVIILCGISQ